MKDYFRKSKKLIKRLSYDELIDRCLSKELRGDTRYQISHHLFRQVWWLDACERSVFERSGRRIILDRSPRPASPATPAHTRWPVSWVWAIFTPIICEQAAVSLMSPHSGLLSIV